ncbi:MAG: TadE/TadG family type IV pilus assembly protein [Acidimicrobiales bacterium]
MRALRRGSGRDQRGAAAVEFALVAIPALILLFGIMYLALLATYSGLAEHGVRNAARFGGLRSIASGNYPSTDEIRDVGAKVDAILGKPISVIVTRTGGSASTALPCSPVTAAGLRKCGDGDVLTVTAIYDAGALGALAGFPGIPGGATITRTATARFE